MGFKKYVFFFGALVHQSPIHTCMLVGRAACDTVLSLEFGDSVLLSNTWLINNESWVPRSADKTFLNHSTVRGYKYWPADHYTQETREVVTIDVGQLDFDCVLSNFILCSYFFIPSLL